MAYLDKGKGANFETFSEVAEALKNGGWVQPCLHHALMWAKLCLRLWCAVEPCCGTLQSGLAGGVAPASMPPQGCCALPPSVWHAVLASHPAQTWTLPMCTMPSW